MFGIRKPWFGGRRCGCCGRPFSHRATSSSLYGAAGHSAVSPLVRMGGPACDCSAPDVSFAETNDPRRRRRRQLGGV